jgi:hypothetical protein
MFVTAEQKVLRAVAMQLMQFRDVVTHKYVAVAVDGEITEYGRS